VVDPRLIVAGKALGSSLVALVVAGVAVTVALLVMGVPVAIDPAIFLLGLTSTVLTGIAAGLLIGSIFIATRHGLQVSAAIMYPVFLLSGTLVPVSSLPEPLRVMSGAISLRWLQEFLASPTISEANWFALLASIGLTAVYGVVGWLLFGRMIGRSKREGNLNAS
jgi:ABC-2 type transport system permease protein